MATTYTNEFVEEHWHDIAESYEIYINPNDDRESLELVTDFLKRNTSVVGITDSGNVIYYTNF
jgi:hypothetical protein